MMREGASEEVALRCRHGREQSVEVPTVSTTHDLAVGHLEPRDAAKGVRPAGGGDAEGFILMRAPGLPADIDLAALGYHVENLDLHVGEGHDKAAEESLEVLRATADLAAFVLADGVRAQELGDGGLVVLNPDTLEPLGQDLAGRKRCAHGAI